MHANLKIDAADVHSQTITCVDCRADFVWSAEEQRYFREQGFHHAPKRCRTCRAAKRSQHAHRALGKR